MKRMPARPFLTKPAVTLEDSNDRYVVRLVFDEREFDQVMASVAERSVLLLGSSGDGRFSVIDVVYLRESIDPPNAEVSLEGPELVITLAKSAVCDLMLSAES